jgi:hypothetical protein
MRMHFDPLQYYLYGVSYTSRIERVVQASHKLHTSAKQSNLIVRRFVWGPALLEGILKYTIMSIQKSTQVRELVLKQMRIASDTETGLLIYV